MAQYGNQIPVDEPETPAIPSADDWRAAMSQRDREAPTENAVSPGRSYGHTYVEPPQ